MRRGAIILCGGKSTRMGRDKASLLMGGEPMLARIVRTILPLVERVVLVAAQGQMLPDLPTNVLIVRDDLPGQGPLAGMATGLRSLQDTDFVLLTSCDVPCLRSEVVSFLFEAVGNADAAVPDVDGRLHPLVAVYRTSVKDRVEALIKAGHRRMLDLCESSDIRRISRDELASVDPELQSLINVNTAEEYARCVDF